MSGSPVTSEVQAQGKARKRHNATEKRRRASIAKTVDLLIDLLRSAGFAVHKASKKEILDMSCELLHDLIRLQGTNPELTRRLHMQFAAANAAQFFSVNHQRQMPMPDLNQPFVQFPPPNPYCANEQQLHGQSRTNSVHPAQDMTALPRHPAPYNTHELDLSGQMNWTYEYYEMAFPEDEPSSSQFMPK